MASGAALLATLALLVAGAGPGAESARILGVFGYIGKSHWDVFEPLLQELARRGHEVVVISHFPQKTPLANYTDISIKGSVAFNPTGEIDVAEMKTSNIWGVYKQHLLLSTLAVECCEGTMSHPEVQKLLRSNQKFDLIITELFTTDCYLAFVHHYKVPYIAMSSCMPMPWAYDRFGNPQNTAFTPNLFHQYGMKMTFAERLQNTWKTFMDNMIFEFLYYRPTEQIAHKYFKELPPLKQIAWNVSLMLVNSHFSLTHARPNVPAVIDVAGIHLAPKKPLPKDIQEFLDGGKDGVVYFNMGSMIRATSLEPAKRQAFMQAFARLGRRVLWKWEEENTPGQPPNVKTSKWLPQFDVLRHPNVRVYIGHGGLLGSVEAAHAGVPMLAIPIFGDQRANVQNLKMAGMALELDYYDVTADSVLAALRELLETPKYRDGASQVAASINDRPQAPLDAAVYWTEYVIRHHGAPRMRCIAADMPWYQRWLLDVIAASAVLAGVALAVLTAVVRALLARFGLYAGEKLKAH